MACATITKLLAVPDFLAECDLLRPSGTFQHGWNESCKVFRESLQTIVAPGHVQQGGDSVACTAANAVDVLKREEGGE